MYRIGEFSRITSLTVKALRYYDEEGILSPSERDKNGYRLYNETDYEKARQIVLLRELDFSIMEIKDCLLYTSPSPRDPKTSRMPSSA